MTAVPLPNPQIPGFNFPESEATILGWSYDLGNNTPGAAAAFTNLHLHGWGLWAALTMQTSQVDNRAPLRVFETWYTPQEADQIPLGSSSSALALLPRRRSAIQSFAQFSHGLEPRDAVTAVDGSETVFGYVKFDPTAAAHLVKQNLLKADTLNQLMLGGAQQIPVFPNTALTLKSAFQIISARDLVERRFYRLSVWTGPPATPQGWGPSQWPGVVWIDIQGGGGGAGQVDMAASTDGSSRTAATTYPVSSMINHRLSGLEAQEFNQSQPGQNAAAGDYAVLVAMHVAGREITRWTWQTFWWTPTPDNPQYPSSPEIASLRPTMLAGPVRNYAMALSYDMITPGQPNVGGQNTGLGIYVYNPYLEARFGPSDLPDSLPGSDPFGRPAANNVGVACNCMSCHMRANYNPGNLESAPKYSGSRYTDMNDRQFTGTLQVDLLWSIKELAK
ncbi:MAG TPA: hypothetical protein VII43_03510 [Opitutaceae bacterium]